MLERYFSIRPSEDSKAFGNALANVATDLLRLDQLRALMFQNDRAIGVVEFCIILSMIAKTREATLVAYDDPRDLNHKECRHQKTADQWQRPRAEYCEDSCNNCSRHRNTL